MFIPKLATQVLLPEFSKLFGENNKKGISTLLQDSLKALTTVAFIICFLVFIFSEQILLSFGPEFQTGSLVLKIMLPSIFIRIISIPFVSFLSGTNFIVHPNIGGLIILFISILLWIALVPSFELVGIAIGYTAGVLIGIGYQIYIAISKLKIKSSSISHV
jgi:O-antigen/teichoic acid export membrane protein